VGSCLLVTKDEFVHHLGCTGGEHWIHAVLFLLHPAVLAATAWLWVAGNHGLLWVQVLLTGAFLLYQALFGAGRARAGEVDNTLYDELGERWYTAVDDPVGLLRAESRLRTGWVLEELAARGGPQEVLDVACGAGFLANPLAAAGHAVTGIDLSRDSLAVAARHDPTGSVTYLAMDALALDFPDGRFDAVCMMDFLEHLEDRDGAIREAARVLKPGGLFFFHTFNRSPLAWLIAIKGVEWAVLNTPRNMHVLRLFLRPEELRGLCEHHGLTIEDLRGVSPRVLSWGFFKLLVAGRVYDDFRFTFTKSLRVGYCGKAVKATRPGRC
jgi:2-polyprenyl-6-hydroxyphenyl methylase/3-demethylubiquinone-9 3-methyltransferase